MATVEELKKMSILDVAQALGMEMKRQSGNTYYWTEHDSFKINTNRNIWHWFSRDKGGNVFSLVQEIKGVSFKEAKHFLETGEFAKVVIDEKPPEPFRYILEPYEHKEFNLGRQYLREERGLSDETIDTFLAADNLAQATRKKGDYFEPVIVFKSRNDDGSLVGASLQGIVENKVQHPERGRLKQIMKNSDGLAGFHLDIGTPKRLVFAEAPIDLMSYYELHKDNLEDVRLVAMEGLKKGVISRYTVDLLSDGQYSQTMSREQIIGALDALNQTTELLKDSSNLITLAVDNDEAGLRFIKGLKDDGIPITVDIPPRKDNQDKMDWNEYLKKEKAGEKQMAEESSHKEFQAPFFSTEILDKYVEEVAQHYTEDIETAEYLFPDGRLVSSWDYGMRGDDHRAIRNYFDVIGRPELDILNDHPKDFWNLVHNGIGAVRLVPETQTALLLEGQALTTLQREILQGSSLKTEVYQEGQAITATYLKRLGVSSEEKDIDEANQKSLEPFSDAQKEHIREFFKTRISDVKTDYVYLPNGQEDIGYYLDGYLFAHHYAELDMLSPEKRVDALTSRLVSEDGQKVDHVALGFDIERIDRTLLEDTFGYNPDTPIEEYRHSEKNIDRIAEKEEQVFRAGFDRQSFADTISLMQKYSIEEVLNPSDNIYHDEIRHQSLLKDLSKVNTDPMYHFIARYMDEQGIKLSHTFDTDNQIVSYVKGADQFSIQDFITIAQEKDLLNEAPSVAPWKAITVTQPVNSYTVFTDKLSKEFGNVSDLYQFVNKKLKRSQRRELSALLSQPGRGTPLDTLMAIDSAAGGNFNVEVNGQSILSLFPNGINEEATEIYFRSSAEIEENPEQETLKSIELYHSEFLADKPDVVEYLQEENASAEEVQSTLAFLQTLDTDRWEWLTPVQSHLDELRQEQHLKQLEEEKLEYGEELFSLYHSPEFNTKPFVVDWLKGQNATASEVQHVLDFIPTVYQEDWYDPDVWKSELDVELSSFRDKQKALDRSQEPSNTGGELFNRNFSSLETEVSGIALQPEESKTQPDFPANVHLHFNIDRTTKSRFKLRSGYHYPEEKDVRILNSYSDSLQSSAQHYLNDFADQKIIYAFSEEEQVRFLEVDFEKRHWMHLTGIMPVYDEHLPSVAEKFIDEIASGHTTFKNVTLGQGFNDKIKVLPMLSELLEAKAFTFNDLSTVQKFQRLELEKGIKPENKDLILALKTDDQSTFPASLMKLSQKIYKTIEPDQKVVLGVFAKKDNEIRTLSVNRDYITDGGKEMLTTLQENRAIDQMKAEEKKQRQAQKIEIVQDSDADGLSDEVEYGQGTDPFGPNVKDTQIENISQPEMDTRSVSEMIAANDTKALAQHMKEGVKQYFDSDQYKTFLTAMSHFNNYSPRNIQLLLAQNPKISRVASANCWSEEFGRYINKGAKALRVWAPSTVTQKDPKTGQSMLDKNGNEIKVTRFRLVPVFDVSQTNGKELPKAIYELEGTHEDYANLYRAAKTVSLDKGVSFKIDSNWSQKGNGYYSPKANEIVIKGGMSEQQTLKTIFHEMAHSDLHNPENISENAMKRSTAELQAESVAYVVANHYGLDTSEYSFAYLAGWSRDPKALSDLEEQLSIVQNEAKSLISRLDTILEKQVTKTVAQSKFMEQMNHFKKQSQEKLAAKQKEREQEESPKKSQARQELNEP